MYVKYNIVLRSKSKDAHMVKLAKELTKGNGYPTTIHAINSCVIKLSKLTKAGKVWRGIKDATLPKEFWVPNEMGVRGGIEYAFSSTTVDREQAMMYAQGANPGDASTIFEMQVRRVAKASESAPRLRPAAPPRGSDRVALLFLTLPPWPPALSPA